MKFVSLAPVTRFAFGIPDSLIVLTIDQVAALRFQPSLSIHHISDLRRFLRSFAQIPNLTSHHAKTAVCCTVSASGTQNHFHQIASYNSARRDIHCNAALVF
jgi:hypothetical protein